MAPIPSPLAFRSSITVRFELAYTALRSKLSSENHTAAGLFDHEVFKTIALYFFAEGGTAALATLESALKNKPVVEFDIGEELE